MPSMKRTVAGCAVVALTAHLAPFEASRLPVEAVQCSAPSFAIPQASPFRVDPADGVPGQPRALARGTFFNRSGSNGTCDCDLAVTVAAGDSAQPDFLVLLQGNEDGTFVKRRGVSVIEVDENPSLLAAGRFNGAVALDSVVAVSNRNGRGAVAIFNANSQTGRYEKPSSGRSSWDTGQGLGALAIGDVNGDQKLDAVIANQGDRSLTVLLGNGSGSFGDPIVVSGMRGIPESLAIGEFSGSGDANDIAVGLTSEGLTSSPGAAVAIVRGSNANPPAFTVDMPIEIGPRGSGHPLVAAASLSTSSSSSSPGPFRDLLVTFSGADSQTSTALLLGRSGGGFDRRAGPSLGSTLARSLVVADFDDDRVGDLAVSVGTNAENGEIRFFQGKTTPAEQLGFRPNPVWRPIPASARPGSLVAGRFGARRDGGAAPPHRGVAAITLRPADMVSVHLGSGRGAFTEPTEVTTRLGMDPTLFVSGDFNSLKGDSPLHDLVYVSTESSGRRLLSVLLSNGAGGFSSPEGAPAVRAGANPMSITAGQFATVPQGSPIDLAIVDRQPAGNPILRILVGNGRGRFTPSQFELQLAHKEVADVVAAPFRGPGMPVDIAIASSKVLTVYFNDGTGRFTTEARAESPLPFFPGTMAVSNRLRPGGGADLVTLADGRLVALLVNIGGGRFRMGLDQNGVFDGAGNGNAVLLGDVTGDQFDDVITFDEDMTLRVFVNRAINGGEGFGAPVVSRPLLKRAVRFAGPGYMLSDFGNGQFGLAATVTTGDGRDVIAVLKSDGKGAFVADESSPPLRMPAFAGAEARVTTASDFVIEPISASGERVEGRRTANSLSGVFRAAGLGNGMADMVVVTAVTTSALSPNACAGDSSRPPMPPPVCRTVLTKPDLEKGLPAGAVDMDSPCCNCNTGPVLGRCPRQCDSPIPRIPICRTTRTYSVLTLYGSTCEMR